MNITRILSSEMLLRSKTVSVFLPAITGLLVLVANYWVFLVVPNEKVMGAVQRIFYFHVASAMACYFSVAVLFIASLAYLAKREAVWDRLGEASANIGLLFASIVLVSGMIWGHSAWNAWWRWEPRLVSFLVLWFLLLSYAIFRPFVEDELLRRRLSAVLGILVAVHVPLVVYSIKILAAKQQLHPEVVANRGLRDSSFVYALLLANAAFISLSAWLMTMRFLQLSLMDRFLGVLRLKSVQEKEKLIS